MDEGCGAAPRAVATSAGAGIRLRRRGRAATAAPPRRRASLGCGVPTAVADLHEGETVLDLGSGAGADVLISARRVGPSGRAIGLDMTDEMLDLARAQRRRGRDRERRVPEGLSRGDPARGRERRRRDLKLRDQPVRRQAHGHPRSRTGAAPRWTLRGLRRDRRPRHGRGRPRQTWPHGLAASPARSPSRSSAPPSKRAGFEQIEIRSTHRVHEHASAAIIRARKPPSNPRAPECRRSPPRSAGPLPKLGAPAVEPVVDRPDRRPPAVARRFL